MPISGSMSFFIHSLLPLLPLRRKGLLSLPPLTIFQALLQDSDAAAKTCQNLASSSNYSMSNVRKPNVTCGTCGDADTNASSDTDWKQFQHWPRERDRGSLEKGGNDVTRHGVCQACKATHHAVRPTQPSEKKQGS